MFAITGATGNLGRLVIEQLLERVSAAEVVAVVRTPGKAQDMAARGVQVRAADYAKPETLLGAFEGVDKLLLISSSEVGRRLSQHGAVIDAAKRANVKLLAYTSILRAERSKLLLAKEHRETELAIERSGLPHVFLRNGWYIENYTERLDGALATGKVLGSAQNGRIAAATRADYAAAAVAALTGHDMAPSYELAGDTAFSMSELAAEVARASGCSIAYQDLPAAVYRERLIGFGVPEDFAGVLVDSDLGIIDGELDDDSHTLSKLIGRPTTSLRAALSKHFLR